MRGRSPGALSLVYPATFPPSICLIHLAGHHCPSLQGRSRSTSPQFSLYPGRASSKGCFGSSRHIGCFIHWWVTMSFSTSHFLMMCQFLNHLKASIMPLLISL